ncbi:MAG: O-methyltransferase [Chloroflexi bacterium]|nr:O-methyltransferase [Chloroflexota bacterium]MCC6892888.1 O-methyltransferase [Anaerolineae bacterium]
MNPEQWSSVDQYFDGLFAPPDAVLEAALAATTEAGLPSINVSPTQGKLLHVLAKAHNVRKILEIGTLAGYSSIWLGRALPADGKLITLEIDPKHAAVARANIVRAGLDEQVEVIIGKAIESLPRLDSSSAGPFDLVFIDADKVSTPDYLTWAMRLTKPGSLIIIDNVVRKGEVADPKVTDVNVQGVQKALAMLAADQRVIATAIQTVGSKGYDGFSLAYVVGT